MNSKTGSNRGPRHAATLAVVAAAAVLATGCGQLDLSLGGLALGARPALVKFSQCMRGHGVPDFPDPPSDGQASPPPSQQAGVNPASPRFPAAVRACQHLLPAGTNISFQTRISVRAHGS
jgi:hypothetical protein